MSVRHAAITIYLMTGVVVVGMVGALFDWLLR